MKSPFKSKTLLGLFLVVATTMPDLSDPLWSVLAETGMSPEWVARTKVATYIVGIAGVIYGRAVADGPLKVV